MDSITSLVVLTAAVALLSAWVAGGRNFSYVGLQIAFSYYLVVFAGFSAPTELAPARDRLIGILLALVIMAFVFDQIWPVRTVTAMRAALATILRGEARLLRLSQTTHSHADLLRQADSFRDQIGKTVAGIRSMNDTIEYEFGVDRSLHTLTGQTILRAALALVALFWNQFAVLHREQDLDFLTQPELVAMSRRMAEGMDAMANAAVNKTEISLIDRESLVNPSLLANPRFGEFARNAVDRYQELELEISRLRTLA
jgi:multidrug resistance protein MdtO